MIVPLYLCTDMTHERWLEVRQRFCVSGIYQSDLILEIKYTKQKTTKSAKGN